MNQTDEKQELPLTSLDQVQLPSVLPPIMILCFNRPDLLQEVLAVIEKQTLLPEKIIAFIDGLRNEKDAVPVQNCLKLLTDFSQKIEVEIIARDKNLGCDLNTILSLTEALSKYSSIVYLEDDTIPNIYFYDRICRLLEVYRDIKKVFSVHGYETSPQGVRELVKDDFIMSYRFFSWGFGTWADRWFSLDLEKIKQSNNPFGKFYDIPLNAQTKLTMLNQFYLEKTGKTDWVITATLACFAQGYVHVVPLVSLIRNIGFGHPESKTYKGSEPSWVNAAYDQSANPNKLPPNTEVIDEIKKPLSDLELGEFLAKRRLYLSLNDTLNLLVKYPSWPFKFLLLKIFFSQQIQRRFNFLAGKIELLKRGQS